VLFEDLYVRSTGTWLPPAMAVADAVRNGLCDRHLADRSRLASVTVAGDEPPAEMGTRAATVALDAADVDSDDIELILYADVYYQGHDLWSPAAYVQRAALGNRCPAIEVRQMSNGGMAALELAASYLAATPERRAALIVAADRFCEPGFDRWGTDPGTIYADGGAAMVLGRRAGPARLACLVTVADADLEAMHRGDDPFGRVPFSVRRPVSLEACKQAYLDDVGLSYSASRANAGLQEALKRTLAEAAVTLDDIDWFVLPHLGWRRLQATYFRRLGIDPERTTWPYGRTVGHLGAGDQIAGLGHLLQSGRARPGERVLLMGLGAGFVWTNALVEVTDLGG
jgi:3-oxoacyl-[acyl-carrier-protein] synthase-3